MRMIDLIEQKKQGQTLNKEELAFIIDGYLQKKIPDYQVSALLMAIYFQGMSEQEVFDLTDVMLNSGAKIDLTKIKGIKCDKHSTGGVGDKTSLVVAPLAAAMGVKMAKMSGRGLGHTGGTLDKLEAIPGFNITKDTEAFYSQVNEIGLAIISQSQEVVPADKVLYALRDVTATVDAIPLIASSIMSKKLASGADYIVLDVKVGSGAFMKDEEKALELAKLMVKIGTKAGKKTIATLTDMSQPLGKAVGNALEVIEAIETLKGNGPKDFTYLCYELTAEILLVCDIVKTKEEALNLVKLAIENKTGLNKLKEMIISQGGNPEVIDNYDLLKVSKDQIKVCYEGKTKAYVKSLDALMIGEAAMLLGAGRLTKDEKVDLEVGIVLNKKIGDEVLPGEELVTIYHHHKNVDETIQKIKMAYVFTSEQVKTKNLIIETVK